MQHTLCGETITPVSQVKREWHTTLSLTLCEQLKRRVSSAKVGAISSVTVGAQRQIVRIPRVGALHLHGEVPATKVAPVFLRGPPFSNNNEKCDQIWVTSNNRSTLHNVSITTVRSATVKPFNRACLVTHVRSIQLVSDPRFGVACSAPGIGADDNTQDNQNVVNPASRLLSCHECFQKWARLIQPDAC